MGLQQTVITKMRKVLVAESPKAADVSMQDASDRNRCHICMKKYEGRKSIKKTKINLQKSK